MATRGRVADMQIKIASGSASAGFATIGTGLAMALPDQKWIGFVLIAIGLLIFVFDIRFEHGEIESGERRLGKLLHSNPRRRMIGLLGMVIFGLGFIASAAVYLWPQTKPWKHDLEDLYTTDTNGLGNLERKWEVGISDQDKGLSTTLILRFRLYEDFNSNIDYISIFIPETHNALIGDEQIYGLIKWLRDQIPPFRKDLQNSVGVGESRPGVPYAEAKDMKFSGRVFIYSMSNFTQVQLGELTTWYKTADMDLQIHGYDYWAANKDR
jgi:hypothetical protein